MDRLLEMPGVSVDALGQQGNLIHYIIKFGTDRTGAHPDDESLARRFLSMGVGHANNEKGAALAATALEAKATELTLKACAHPRKNNRGDDTTDGDGLTQVPAEVLAMPWLLKLDLSENTIFALPPSFFDALPALQELDLSDNCLTRLSPTIRKLTQLRVLKLYGNRLRELPVEMGELGALHELGLEGTNEDGYRRYNPIISPPPEVEGSKHKPTFTETDADVASRVLAFLRELALGTVENREVKVPVVGRSEVGKTSLINAMTEGESRLVRVGDRTVGVEQRMYEIKAEVEVEAAAAAAATVAGSATTTAMAKKKITLQLRIFDFAGQREYYLVSQ